MNNESQWIQAAIEGDPAAFEQLVLKYQKPVYNLALRTLGDPDEAFDAAQEAFIRAWKKLDSVRADAAFSSWLYRLTTNVCLDMLRANKRKRTISLTVEEGEAPIDLPDPTPTPEDALMKASDREAVRAAMDSLEPDQRQVLTLRIINDLSYQQIAEVLDVAEGTVKSRLSRARQCLKNKLLRSGNLPDGISSEKRGRRGRNGA